MFAGTNCANPIVMTDGLGLPGDVSSTDGTTTPLLTDASGNVYGVRSPVPPTDAKRWR